MPSTLITFISEVPGFGYRRKHESEPSPISPREATMIVVEELEQVFVNYGEVDLAKACALGDRLGIIALTIFTTDLDLQPNDQPFGEIPHLKIWAGKSYKAPGSNPISEDWRL